MFKEFILAIILGALLGFGLTGTYFAYKSNQKNINSDANPTPTLSATTPSSTNNIIVTPLPTEKPTADSLVIDSPENESIINNSKTTVSGKSTPKSIVIITTSAKTYTQNTTDNGEFSIDIELESGANKINVSAIDTKDNQTNIQLIVTYSTAKI